MDTLVCTSIHQPGELHKRYEHMVSCGVREPQFMPICSEVYETRYLEYIETFND